MESSPSNSIMTLGSKIQQLTPSDLAFVLLHGREDSTADMAEVAAKLCRMTDAVLIPKAETGGWYPLSIYSPLKANEPMLTQSLQRVDSILKLLKSQGVGRERVVLLGFSQGACLVAQFLFEHAARYAAAILFSGGALGTEEELAVRAGSLQQTPVLLSASRADPYIRWPRIERTAMLLGSMQAKTMLSSYEQASHAIATMDYAWAEAILEKARNEVAQTRTEATPSTHQAAQERGYLRLERCSERAT